MFWREFRQCTAYIFIRAYSNATCTHQHCDWNVQRGREGILFCVWLTGAKRTSYPLVPVPVFRPTNLIEADVTQIRCRTRNVKFYEHCAPSNCDIYTHLYTLVRLYSWLIKCSMLYERFEVVGMHTDVFVRVTLLCTHPTASHRIAQHIP